MEVMAWRVWYTEGRQYDSTRHAPMDLPSTGLLAVREYGPPHPRGEGCRHHRILDGADWYWWEEGRWHKKPSVGWDGWVEKPKVACSSCLKRGDGVSDEEFEAITKEVMEAPCPK